MDDKQKISFSPEKCYKTFNKLLVRKMGRWKMKISTQIFQFVCGMGNNENALWFDEKNKFVDIQLCDY